MMEVDEVATAYAEAALWTAGVDEMSGEYVADPDKVSELMGPALAAARVFLAKMGTQIDYSDLDPAQVGHDLHLTREGHGAGFWDRPNSDEPIMRKADEVAREMGPDYAMQDELMYRYPTEAFAA